MLDTPKPAYVKTLTDGAWDGATLAERALHVARSQDSVREAGTNWGPKVSLYLRLAGIFSPAPWCAAFVTWCLVEAGADRKKLPKFAASTYFWYAWANKTGRARTFPERGRVAVQNGAGGGHIWFCLSGADPHRTLEGNTNPGGSREGYGVFERKRHATNMRKHPRWCFIAIGDDLY